MTEQERQMMATIHVYGMIYSMSDKAEQAVKDYMRAVLEKETEA